jgi:hypothetical protein
MAQVEIKSPEGFSYSIDALAQTQGPDVRVGGIQFAPLIILAQDCIREPRKEVRPALQSGLNLTKEEIEEMYLAVSVVDVSGTRTIVNLLGRYNVRD